MTKKCLSVDPQKVSWEKKIFIDDEIFLKRKKGKVSLINKEQKRNKNNQWDDWEKYKKSFLQELNQSDFKNINQMISLLNMTFLLKTPFNSLFLLRKRISKKS